jgi:hypothetical protein
MRSFILGLFFLLGALLSGCAATATKGDLTPVSEFPKVEKTGTLLYRTTLLTPGSDGSLKISPYPEADGKYTELIEETRMFARASRYYQDVKTAELSGKDVPRQKEKALKIKFPVDADYFLDLQYTGKDGGMQGSMYWGLVHMISLGLIPITFSNDVHLRAILYDRNGKKLRESKADDSSTIWGWSPLVFFNGFRMFNSQEELSWPVQKNSIEHALVNLDPED